MIPPSTILHAEAFGPGRFTRAAFRVREQGPHDRGLSFVAVAQDGEKLLGSVRMTWIETAGTGARGLLLGPLAVKDGLKGKGIGKALMRRSVDAARDVGAPYILLVGDKPYYWPFGFETLPRGQVQDGRGRSIRRGFWCARFSRTWWRRLGGWCGGGG